MRWICSARLESGSSFDVVVTDYMMPGMDGHALTQQIHKSFPELPVLLITGYTGPTEDVRDLPLLTKPFSQAEIAAALRSLFEDEKIVPFPRKHKKRPDAPA